MEHTRGHLPNTSTTRVTHVMSTGAGLHDPLMSAEGVGLGTMIFEAGAHTHWHSHGNGQVLLIDSGRGVVATRAGEAHSLMPGDLVWAPPGEEHFHGATPDSYCATTAVSLGVSEWLEPVDPAVYQAACEATKDS